MQTIKITYKSNYAIIQLNRPTANPINHEMVLELKKTFTDLEKNDSVQGVILTGSPKFFSAGLDVVELYGYEREKMHQFFIDFGEFHVQLVRFTKPLICAINGHSPAGGTVFAIGADYRIMVKGEKFRIGLNEVSVSVQVSHNLVEGYAFWIGKSLAHRYLLEGKLLTCEEALACHLVDELVTEEELMPKAEAKMQHYLQAHSGVLKNTKFRIRREWLEKLDQYGEEDLKEAEAIWWNPDVRKRMKGLVDWLTKKKN